MVEENFLSKLNFGALGASAAVVTAMTLMLSKGNVLAASGAGITTGASIAVVNRRNGDLKKAFQDLLEVLQKELGIINMNPGEYAKLIQEAREKLQSLKREETGLNHKCNELEQQLAIARKSLKLLEQNLQEKERETGRLNNEISTRQKNLEDINRLIKESLEISPEDRKALSDVELARLKQEINHSKNELNNCHTKYQEICLEKRQLQEYISKQEDFKHNLKAEVAELNAKKNGLSESIKGLETREVILTQEFSDLKTKKAEIESIILDLQEKNPNLSSLQKLQTDIEKLVLAKQTLTRQIADFHSQLKNLITKKEALTEITPKLAKAKIELKSVTQRVVTQQETLEDLKFQDRELKQEREKLEIVSQNLKQELSEAKAKIIVINSEKEKLLENNNFLTIRKQDLDKAITSLSDEEQELQQRIADIKEKNPNLDSLEELHKQIEKIRLEKSGLEGEKEALQSQLESLGTKVEKLEATKGELQSDLHKIEAQLLPKQIELERAIAEIERLKPLTKELEKQATELELLRVTYDALSSEKNSFETRINQLRPEITGLEAQKAIILQAIRENESEYNKVEQQRAELRRLNSEISSKYAELQDLKRDVAHTQGVLVSLEAEKGQLEAKITKLKQYIQELKAEIEELEAKIEKIKNSTALQALRKPLWDSLPQDKQEIAKTEEQFISAFIKYLEESGFTFPQRVIKAFHTSLKVQDISALVILAGISGTGKSQLPQRYTEYIGAQAITLAVQPRWDSPQDLQGFYNYMEKKYKPTDLMRGLYQYQNKFNKEEEIWERRKDNDPIKDRLIIVLLDEMNLARVEYYFSDFLSKLENKKERTPYLDLDVGSLPLPPNERRLDIPQQFLFVGTMNEDETTQSLSDKVLDRANVLTFGKPEKLKLREEFNCNKPELPEDYISYSQFKKWTREPDPDSELVRKISNYLERANKIMNKLGHPFAHRVYQAIVSYVVNYPGVAEGNQEAFNAALADQFGQKLLPKLRGLMIHGYRNELYEFSGLINDIGDEALIKAFETAKKGHFGQFQWRGFVYLEESEQELSLVEA